MKALQFQSYVYKDYLVELERVENFGKFYGFSISVVSCLGRGDALLGIEKSMKKAEIKADQYIDAQWRETFAKLES